MIARILALLILTLAVGQVPAEAQGAIAIRAGWLVDVDDGLVLRDQLILVRDGRIESVGPAVGALPAGATLLDLSRYTVLPGLIECHAHLVGDFTSSDPLAPLQASEDDDMRTGTRNARATLMAGFTTVRDVGTYRAFSDVRLREAIDQGRIPGPRMVAAGAYVTIRGGGGEVVGDTAVAIPPEMRRGVANTPEEVRRAVADLLEGGADFIKLIATGAVLTEGTEPGEAEYGEEAIRAAVEEARRHGTYVIAHAHGAEGIKRAVRAGVRSIEHGSLIDDEAIALMREHGTWLVADIFNGDYIDSVGRRDGWSADILRKNFETTEAQRDGFRRAVAAGVRIAYGTDTGVYPHEFGARQLPYMVRYGMTPMQAVQSATIEAARLLFRDDRLGSVAPGKYADLIAIEGNAMADLGSFERVAFVMKGGVVVKSPMHREE